MTSFYGFCKCEIMILLTFIFLQVEKEIGQVWRQMGIMYSKVSNSIEILEKVIKTALYK